MNQRAEYLLQVLEKIGSPLMASILQAPGRGPADETQKDAQRMAELLARTTQASIEMSRAIDFGTTPDQGDSLRVALAALAGGLVGAYFKNAGKAPGENDLKKMTAAMQTVLTYSENFMPGADATMRLDNLTATGQAADPQQAALQYIDAFIPVVNAVTVFPFGQPEQKLIMDVSTRLIHKATELRRHLFGPMAPVEQKRLELAILGVLTKIYAACHDAETARLMALSEEQRAMAGLGVDSVWKTFDLRISILEVLAKSLVPATGEVASGGSTQGPAPAASAPPPAPPPFSPPPQQAIPPAAPAADDSPLSMFAKKPAAEAAPAAPLPQSPPPANPSPVQQSAQQPAGGGPMSFFKKDDQKQ